MYQGWHDLLFLHWRVSAERLRPFVPSELTLEEFDGSAWLGLTLFRVVGARPRFLPPIPGLSSFPEMNVRTYVRFRDRPGTYFFSLEAASRPVAAAARLGYRLPYVYAGIRMRWRDGWTEFESRRDDYGIDVRYRPSGPIHLARPGSREAFLIERYALFQVLRNGRVLMAEIHHPPWALQAAEARIGENTVPAALGIEPFEDAPICHFAARQETLIWPPVLQSTPGAKGSPG